MERVRLYSEEMPLPDAVNKAVEDCIKEGILADFLRKNKAEVIYMSIFEYDEQLHERTLLEEGIEIGEQRGIEIGERRGIEIGEQRGIEIGERRGIEIGEQRGIEIGERRGIEIGEQRGIEIGEQRGMEIGSRKGIRGSVTILRSLGHDDSEIKAAITAEYDLSPEQAEQYIGNDNEYAKH